MHAIGAELVVQAAGRAEHAAELADVLAEHDHARIAAHLDLQRVVHGLDDVHLGHGRRLLGWRTTVFRARWQVEQRIAALGAQAGVPPGARSL